MFNLQKHADNVIKPTEKYLRDEGTTKENEGNDIAEKALEGRTGEQDKVLEKSMEDKQTVAESDNVIIEKAFDRVKGYLPHRRNDAWLSVPPIAAVVEKLQKDRMADWKEEKTSHWTNDKSKQNGKLPAWPKSPAQHDKIVLQNDPRRFETLTDFPPKPTDTKSSQSEKVKDVKPLVGTISKEAISHVAYKIKTGSSLQYDSAIVAILREANDAKRELLPDERSAIKNLKIARTKALLDEGNNQ